MGSIFEMKIEELRLEMVGQAVIYGSLTHEKVIKVSQLLDLYILVYQKHLLKKFNLKLIS